jgi:hypothetical protein
MLFKQLLSIYTFFLRASAECFIKLSSVRRLYLLLEYYVLIGGLSIASFLFCTANSSRAEIVAAQSQLKARETGSPTTVLDLQPFRTVHSIKADQPNGQTAEVTLINLNPKVNQWYVLQLHRDGNNALDEYHLENPYPKYQRLVLDENSSEKLVLTRNDEVLSCTPWQFFGDSQLEAARKSRQDFAPLCGGKLYLRNPTKGHRTAIESVTDFLRDKIPGGEAVVGLVKDTLFQDAYLENTRTTVASMPISTVPAPDFPTPAAIDPLYTDKLIVPAELGIQVENGTSGMLTGHWYGVKNNSGIFVSLIQPKAVAPDILKSYPHLTNPLDSVEAGALAYLVAFDLSRFELGFAVGTEHPRVGWSERTLEQVRVLDQPGPDGIGTIAPLVANGIVNPVEAARAVATFTGGFKRSHGAFKYGDLANRNHGSHYGFMENGVVLSTLQPDLATLLVRDDGAVEMKTWSEKDNQNLGQIIQARQNGVPLVEWDTALQKPVPGRLVTRWGRGNWSGSADKKIRTLRAGVALQQTDNKRFLIYGYFSTTTPSAMARVFQAYNCLYAMHLDMNALEHTYLALYHQKGKHFLVQHLIQGMSVLDKSEKGIYIPRFLGYSDNRDFFYLMQREQL